MEGGGWEEDEGVTLISLFPCVEVFNTFVTTAAN